MFGKHNLEESWQATKYCLKILTQILLRLAFFKKEKNNPVRDVQVHTEAVELL